MQAAIIAGGRGTRLAPLTNDMPKPMIPVNGKPFLEYELSLLKSNGITDFVICLGYLGNLIQEYFGNGDKFGIRIDYCYDGDKPMDVIGALKRAEPLLHDRFFMTYADCYLRADYAIAMQELEKSKKMAMMLVFKNHNKYGTSDVEVFEGRVINYNKKVQTSNMIYINYGVTVLRRDSLKIVPADTAYGEEEFFGKLIRDGQLIAHVVGERFYEIGTIQSLSEFKDFVSASNR